MLSDRWQSKHRTCRSPRRTGAVPLFLLSILLACGIASGNAFAGATMPQPAVEAKAAGDGPHDLAGYDLGMTLDNFRALPLIDRTRFPKAQVLCSGDADLQRSTALGDMWQMPDETRVGMIRCNVFHPDPVNVSWWAPLLPTIGGQPGKEATYFFLPEAGISRDPARAGASYRLLFSQYVLPVGVADDIRGRLTAQFGQPARRQAGADALNNVAWNELWQSRDAWVLLDSKDHARKFTVTYVAVAVAESAAGRSFDVNGNPLFYSIFSHLR